MSNTRVIFLIGMQKAGTSALHQALSVINGFNAPLMFKDLHYYSNPKIRERYKLNIHDYIKENTINIFGGVNTFFFINECIDDIIADFPDAEFMLVLRNPYERAVSSWRYFTELGLENRPFKDCWYNEYLGTDHDKLAQMSYRSQGLYFDKLKFLIKRVGNSRVHIFSYKTLLGDVNAWLSHNGFNRGLAELPRVNVTGAPRSKFLNNLVFGDSVLRRLIASLPLDTPFWLRIKNSISVLLRKYNSDRKNIQSKREILSEEMKNYYDSDIDRVKQLIGVDLSKS